MTEEADIDTEIFKLEHILLEKYKERISDAILEVNAGFRPATSIQTKYGRSYTFLNDPSKLGSPFSHDYILIEGMDGTINKLMEEVKDNLPEAANIYHQLYPSEKKIL